MTLVQKLGSIATATALSLASLVGFAAPASAAATCVVDSFTDGAGSDADLSRTIRFCLGDITDQGTITFAHGGGPQSIEIESSLSVSGKIVTIDGGELITIKRKASATGNFSLLVTDSTFTIDGIAFTDGVNGNGAAIYANGQNGTIRNSEFIDNLSASSAAVYFNGGLVTNSTFTRNSGAYGAAVYADSTLTVTDSEFTDNISTQDGGAIYSYGDITVSNSTFRRNSANDEGGAIRGSLDINVNGSTFASNSAGDDGGALWASVNITINGPTTFTSNLAINEGGAVWADEDIEVNDSTFTNNRVTASGSDGGAIYNYDDGYHLVVNRSIFTGNTAVDQGGAIWKYDEDVLVTDSTFISNGASEGGAIFNEGGDVDPTRSVFDGNTATNDGGAIWAYSDIDSTASAFTSNTAGNDGGALYTDVSDTDIIDSYFALNQATRNGGAIEIDEHIRITNSTFYQNSASGQGGAIHNDDNATDLGFIQTSTFVDNQSGTGSSAVYWVQDQDMYLFGNLFLGQPGQLQLDSAFSGRIVDSGSNVSSDSFFGSPVTLASVGAGVPETATLTLRPIVPFSSIEATGVVIDQAAIDSWDSVKPTSPSLTADQQGTTRILSYFPGAQYISLQCDPGTYSENGNRPCITAPVGKFVETSGANEAIACPAGTYQPNQGSTACLIASPGYFVAFSGSEDQLLCPVGTYQPNAGSVECMSAEPGYFVANSGSTSQTACPSGLTSQAAASVCYQAGAAVPSVTYVGPVISAVTVDSGSTDEALVTGIRLDTIDQVSVSGTALASRLDTAGHLFFDTSSLVAGTYRVEFLSSIAGVTLYADLVIETKAVTATSDRKVNAGSFKGYVAVYAKGYEGSRLSAKVGKDWVIVSSIPSSSNNLYRHVEFTGAGVDVAVRIYIDRVLIDTINLTTK